MAGAFQNNSFQGNAFQSGVYTTQGIGFRADFLLREIPVLGTDADPEIIYVSDSYETDMVLPNIPSIDYQLRILIKIRCDSGTIRVAAEDLYVNERSDN